MPTLGAFIRRRRIELGMTQEHFAEKIGDGARQADVSRIENDRVTLPRRERLERIAEALDVPIGYLLVRSGWAGADDVPFPDAATDPLEPDTTQQMVPTPDVVEVLEQMKTLVEQVETLIDESVTLEPAPEDGPSAPEPAADAGVSTAPPPPTVQPPGSQD